MVMDQMSSIDSDALLYAVYVQCSAMTDDEHLSVRVSPVKGDAIKHLRAQMNDGKGMPRHKFAAAADISPSTLVRAEEGEPGTTVSTLSRIARVLGVPLSTIYENDALANMDAVPSSDPPPWCTQLQEQMDARLSAIEATQAEILRALRSNR